MSDDVMQFTILEDGTIKLTSDPISAPNHANADAFFQTVARLSGGEVEREKRTDVVRGVGDVVHRFEEN